MCDRPGCHEPVPKSGRSQARYCCSACRQAVRRVVDRERKWQFRGTFRCRRAREQEYQAARATLQTATRHRQRDVSAAGAFVTRRTSRAGRPSIASPGKAPYLGTEWFDAVFAPQESQA